MIQSEENYTIDIYKTDIHTFSVSPPAAGGHTQPGELRVAPVVGQGPHRLLLEAEAEPHLLGCLAPADGGPAAGPSAVLLEPDNK